METVANFKQTAKVGTAGNFINQMMANNNSVPEVGKGATELLYSDRHCYEVIEVSEDKTLVKLELLSARVDTSKGIPQIGHQDWILEPTGQFINIQWRKSRWCILGTEVVFTKEYIESVKDQMRFAIARTLTEEQKEAVYAGNVFPSNVVEGITKRKNTYNPIKLIFGVKDYRYDWEFY